MMIHPGHTFSTRDVYDGLCAGFRANGCEVVEFKWDQHLQTFNAMAWCSKDAGIFPPDKLEDMLRYATFVSSADSISVALEAEVDLAFVVTGTLFPPKRAQILAKLGIPVACYGTEAPYFTQVEQTIAPAYTHWFTQERRAVDGFRRVNPNSFYLPMAYNPETHRRGPIDPAYVADVVFVGGGYPERKAMIQGADWTGIDLQVRGTLWDLDIDAIRAQEQSILTNAGRYSAGNIPNEMTTRWHRGSKISLNINRRMSYLEVDMPIAADEAESLGPRAYEVPAVGGFLLTDDSRPELFDVFGDSAATFRWGDAADLTQQVRYWLTHDDARQERARAQRQAVMPHTWTARAAQVLETIF